MNEYLRIAKRFVRNTHKCLVCDTLLTAHRFRHCEKCATTLEREQRRIISQEILARNREAREMFMKMTDEQAFEYVRGLSIN